MLPSSTVLSLAGAGTVLTVIFFGELGHLKAKCSPRPRKVFSRWCIKELYLQQHSINGFKSKKQNSLSSFAFGKKAEDSFFSDVNEDTDDMYEDLINNYGKVVFSRKDKKPASAEIDDDAESLSFAMELASVASEVKAADIKVLFVKPLVYWTRFFIIATAFSHPQIDAIGSRMRDRTEKKYGKIPTGDTKPNSWTLLDFVNMLLAQPIFFSPNFPTLIKKTNLRASLQPHNNFPPLRVSQMPKPLGVRARPKTLLAPLQKKSGVQICHSFKKESEVGGNDERDWTTSFLLFLLWAALIYYVFFLTPNQTPSRDLYFLKKLLNLKGDDGFRMNEVLVSLWYIMGLWPLVYNMLLLPTGRSSKNSIPVWPFLILSCFGGAYVLLPYFVLWKPPAPPVEETQLKTWPLNFLESKVTALISLVAGVAIIIYAGLAGQDVWKEFYQYFRESKFIHITSIDFIVLSTFAPFWVYNDMTARKWFDKGSWLLPISLIPYLGPGLYLLLRPSLSAVSISQTPVEPE